MSSEKRNRSGSGSKGITGLQSVKDRLRDHLVGLGAAAQAVGLENHRAMLVASQRRVDDSHKAGMKALGVEVETGDDDMGDMYVTGDIATMPDKPRSSVGKLAAAAVAGLGILTGGYVASKFLDQDKPAVIESQDTDTRNTIRFVD